jgi:hypothetical protein
MINHRPQQGHDGDTFQNNTGTLLYSSKDQILSFAVLVWIPAFVDMTAEIGANVRPVGERRYPDVLPGTQIFNLNGHKKHGRVM